MSKRKRGHQDASTRKKVQKSPATLSLNRDLLDIFYPHCASLRKYILASLPQASRLRRRKIESLGSDPDRCAIEKDLCKLLDSTLVCYRQLTPEASDNRWEQWLSFSQKGEDSSVSLTGTSPIYSQAEIVDFIIWLLFSRDKSGFSGPKHLLCDGYRRSAHERAELENIPGVFRRYPNDQVASLKASPWPQLLALLGQSGEKIMIDMLVDCSIFVAIEPGWNNFYQISGYPISELENGLENKRESESTQRLRKISEITLVRSRMFYARPSLTSKGNIQAGYKRTHVLNRYPYTPDNIKTGSATTNKRDLNTVKVMMYIFPRQFGFHNVFTSIVDRKTTAQKFQDYTNRDEEIARHMRSDRRFLAQGVPKIPKRLRGRAQDLVRRLQIRHHRCSYIELVRHYCPSPLDALPKKAQEKTAPISTSRIAPGQVTDGISGKDLPAAVQRAPQTQTRTQGSRVFEIDPSVPVVDLAAPLGHVSAFLQAGLSKVIPDAFFGEDDDLRHNKALLAKKVHHFITLRRYETMSLHELSQGFKISNLAWLQLPDRNGQRPSRNETLKQLELFHELLYYVFDSLLIPLARNTFYVTESSSHRNQVFYFRHDVWKMISERAMSAIKDGMLEELKVGDVQHAMGPGRLGFSQIRLLPKGAALRPIMNLRRRYPTQQNQKILGPSINAMLAPIHNVLKLEKHLKPSNLGATLSSVADIYARLKEFRSHLPSPLPRLYFVKADVQSAFDTIPQQAVLKLMMAIPSHASYKIFKHAEVKPGKRSSTGCFLTVHDDASAATKPPPKPVRRWTATAYPSDESRPFLQRLEDSSETSIGVAGAGAVHQRKNTVFVNSAVQSRHDTRDLLHLLAEHVTENHIKVGKKVFRQRQGIPQGSVLSSFLCNYFYADLEAKHLDFLREEDTDASRSLLLRLIDDFLLITTDKKKAQRFAEVLHRGVPEYGVQVSPKKSLANFAVSVPSGDGQSVEMATVDSGADFPYCGVLISCRTLEMKKDCQRAEQTDVSNTLTVEHGRIPGQTFERKVLDAFMIQSHLMFYDTSHNSLATVLETLRAAFRQTALKMWAYMRSLHRTSRLRPGLVKMTIMRTVEASYLVLTSNFRKSMYRGYECSIRKSQVVRQAYEAFEEVLSAKQTQHTEVVAWLRSQITKCHNS
ncbi:hypothetical protein ACQRIU_003317 [Beauveria bassiana]